MTDGVNLSPEKNSRSIQQRISEILICGLQTVRAETFPWQSAAVFTLGPGEGGAQALKIVVRPQI